MPNLRDKLRDQPPEKPSKGGKGGAKRAIKGKSKRIPAAKASGASGMGGMEVNRKLLLAAVGIAAVAGLLAINYLSSAKDGILSGGQKVKVYVVSDTMSGRKQLDSSNVETREVPKALLPEGALTDEKDVMGKILLYPAAKGEILDKQHVGDASAATGVTPKLKPNERGFLYVPQGANDIALVKPDDYVDLTATIQTQSGRYISTKVAQRVRVLSVGNRFSNAQPTGDDANASSNYGDLLTFAVPADKVALLAALKQQGNLSMALRAPGDTTITPPEVPEAELERYVMGGVPQPVVSKPVQPRVIHKPVVVHPKPQPHPRPVEHHVQAPPPRTGVDVYVGTQLVHKK